MDSSSVPAAQLAHLQSLLGLLLQRNRFYAPRLKQAGVDSTVGSLEEFSARMPFTRKAELVDDQTANPPYGTNLTFPVSDYTRFCQTSGTTARPLAILDTPASWDSLLENWLQIYRAAEVTSGSRIYFAFSFGPFLGFWTAFEAGLKAGCLCLPGGGLSSVARLHALIEHRAEVLCCTPTYALHLAEIARREQVDLSRAAIRKVIVAGEPGGSIPDVRARIGAAWNGSEVFDHYGMTEIGPVAYQRAGQPGLLRIIEEAYYAEVIDPATGAPAKPGEPGELVLTTLRRTACPLLRYRTGDLVRRNPAESGFALDGGIIGRADDMVVVRGVNIYPSAVDAVVRSVPEISEYRVEVSRRGSMTELALSIEASAASGGEALERALTAAFSLRIPVQRVPDGTLPRFEMKARRWVRQDLNGN